MKGHLENEQISILDQTVVSRKHDDFRNNLYNKKMSFIQLTNKRQ